MILYINIVSLITRDVCSYQTNTSIVVTVLGQTFLSVITNPDNLNSQRCQNWKDNVVTS